MKATLTTSLLAAALGLTVIAAPVAAGIEANIGVTSNYIWRGMTQSNDQAAVSGGLDYGHDSGFYAGTWASSLGGSQYELDLYAGFGGEVGAFGYDLGAIIYMYPIGDADLDFTEIYANLTFSSMRFGVAATVDAEYDPSDDTYAYIGTDFALASDYSLALTYGSYFDADNFGDQNHLDIGLSKGDFGFTVVIPSDDIADGDTRVAISWGTTF